MELAYVFNSPEIRMSPLREAGVGLDVIQKPTFVHNHQFT